jgi:hypothetical protein
VVGGFLVDLGNGWFVNELGELVPQPEGWTGNESTPVVKAPGGGFDIDFGSWSAGASSVKGAMQSLKSKGDPGKSTLDKYGLSELLPLVDLVEDLAAAAALFTGAVGFAVAALKMLDVLKFGGEDAVSKKIDDWGQTLVKEARGNASNELKRELTDVLAPFTVAGFAVDDFIHMTVKNPHEEHPDQWRTLHDEFDQASKNFDPKLLNSAWWTVTYYADDYDWAPLGLLVWSWLYAHTAQGDRKLMPIPNMDDETFEYRLMLPVLSYAVQNYLLLTRTILPEFRSVGLYTKGLRGGATAARNLAEQMRNSILGRTRLTADDFSGVIEAEHDVYPQVRREDGSLDPQSLPGRTIGAFDLRAYTTKFLQDRQNAALAAGIGDKFVTIYPYWRPSVADIEELPPRSEGAWTFYRYQIRNPDACAAEANKLAEQEYVRLLAFSGYLHLSQVSALLALNASEPDRSETLTWPEDVRRDATRQLTAVKPSKAHSADILFVGQVTADATLLEQHARVQLVIETQPRARRDIPIRYRLLLRTLKARFEADAQVEEPSYDDYHRARLVDEDGQPALRLVSEGDDSLLLDEVEILAVQDQGEWRPPPDKTLALSGEIGGVVAGLGHTTRPFRAATFDWYISDTVVIGGSLTNWEPMPTLDPHGLAHPHGAHRAQRRNGEERAVALSWLVQWEPAREPYDSAQLVVTLSAEPGQRNFTVQLVVEEILQTDQGSVLHTAYPVTLSTALTSVPESFFTDEQEAEATRDRIAHGIASEYRQLARVLPGQEQERNLITPDDLRNPDTMRNAVLRVQEAHPELVAKAVRKEGLSVAPIHA